MLWQGVPISDLLQEAGASPKATTLIFTAADGYTTALPLSYVVQNNLILAYKVNNVTLPAELGFPLCLTAQNQYGYKWIKWVTEIDVSNNSGYLGFWESRGYPNNATVGGDPNITSPNSYESADKTVGVCLAVIIMATTVYIIFVKKHASRGPNSFFSSLK
jgi:DMSO/TMAO reductase YedYZ molybdopterin-dependent catalytic subunit